MPKPLFLRSLLIQLGAFKEARKGLLESAEGAAETIRRIAHVLNLSARKQGYSDVAAAATEVEIAGEGELRMALRKLTELMEQNLAGYATRQINILLVEDSLDDAEVLRTALEAAGYRVVTARTMAEAERVLQEDVYLVVLDLFLPDGDGRNFLLRLKEDQDTATLPVIVVSSQLAPKVHTECLALGAEDFLFKPVDAARFVEKVTGSLRRSANLSYHSWQDQLTGLPNRAALQESLARAGEQVADKGLACSVALVDLDRFRAVNQEFGPRAGDRLLAQAGQLLAQTLGEEGLVGRWEGERFLTVFSDSSKSRAVEALEAARKLFRKNRFDVGDGRHVDLTFSAGVTELVAGEPVQEALARVDQLLYLAKVSGKNQILASREEAYAPRDKVLLAEDEDSTALIVKELLENDGFEVVRFDNGADALRAALSMSLSLILLDVQMPEMDGFELLSRLRGNPSFSGIPIAMLTVHGSEEDVTRGFSLGADDYIVKPFSPQEVLVRVRRLLKTR